MKKGGIYPAIVIAIIIIMALPFSLLLGPGRLKYYLHRELVYKAITDKVTAGSKADRDKAMKLMDYAYLHVPSNLQLDKEIVDKHPLNDLLRGLGECDQIANTLITLARKARIKGRLIFLRGHRDSSRHSLCDLHVEGDFRIFDPTFNWVFLNKDNKIANFADIQNGRVYSDLFVSMQDSGVTDFSGRKDSYPLLFAPDYPPVYFRLNYEQDKKRFLLSRMMDLYYDIFGDAFLALYQETFFRLAGVDRLMRARYKHLAFRFDSALSDYDHIIENNSDELAKIESMYFSNIIYWDKGELRDSISGFEKLLNDFPEPPVPPVPLELTPLHFQAAKRRAAILRNLRILYKLIGDPEKSAYYFDLI